MSNRLADLEDDLSPVATDGDAAVTRANGRALRAASQMIYGRSRRDARRVQRRTGPAVSQAQELAANRPISYRVPGSVPLIAQPGPMGGWAACLAMLMSWRDHHSLGIEEAVGRLDARFLDLLHRGAGVPRSEKASLLAAAGIVANPPMAYRPDDWEMLLRQNGPLWLTDQDRDGTLFALRSLIVVGIRGTGTDVVVDVINPASGRQTTQPLHAVLARITGHHGHHAMRRLQVLHVAQGTPNGAPGTATPTAAPAPPAPADGPAAPAPTAAVDGSPAGSPGTPPSAAAAPAAPTPAPAPPTAATAPPPPAPPAAAAPPPSSPPAAAPATQQSLYALPFDVDLTQLHAYQDSVRWRLTPTGLEIEGSGVERTPGTPTTVTTVWETFGDDINAAATEFNVPCVLIVATICTESRGDPNAIRLEPGYVSDEQTPGKVSPGLMQTLISTARSALPNDAASIDRNWLFTPRNSIRAGTAFIVSQRAQTNLDPPMVAAAYNAGGIYHQTGPQNRWKMRQYPIGRGDHCDRFVKWFNDAVAVLDQHTKRPSVGYSVLLGTTGTAPAAAPADAGTPPAPPTPADAGVPAAAPADAGAAAQSLSMPRAWTFAAVDYDVPGPVPVVTQPNTMQCWAATATSMVSWKDQVSYPIETVLDRAGPEHKQRYTNNQPIYLDGMRSLAQALGMTMEPPVSYSVEGLLNLLRASGPLWVWGDQDMTRNYLVHARIITGMHGDGTPSGTMLTIVDPLRSAPYSESFIQLAQRMEAQDATDFNAGVIHY